MSLPNPKLFLPFVILFGTLFATKEGEGEPPPPPPPPPNAISKPLAEIKVGYFFFSNATMRQVYDDGGLNVQLCGSYPLWKLSSKWGIDGYGSVGYIYLSGESINGHEKTSLWSIPVNVGLKPVYAINNCANYYFTIGPRYFYIHQHNDSPYVYKNSSNNEAGFFVNTGINYRPHPHFVVDFFGEYCYGKTQFNGGSTNIYTEDIQVGGFTFGVGLNYEF